MPDYRRSGPLETRREDLESFIWQARVARDVLKAANADPYERAKATCLWASLYHVVHSPRDETAEERAGRLDCLESLAAKAGISPLSFYLREFALDIGHAILASPDPEKKLARILYGPPKRGNKKRPFRESIEIAVAVKNLHDTGITLTEAYETVANTLGKSENFTSDAVRMIYGRAMKDRATASLVRLVVAGLVEI
jgi:hypothetical protein